MSDEQVKELSKSASAKKLLADRVLARRRLIHFTKMTHPSYEPGWVHHDMCRRLEVFSEQVRQKKSPRLMIMCPPRTGKSELASIRFPAWHLGHAPNHEIINVGYNLELPTGFSRKVRGLIQDPVYAGVFPGTALDPQSQSAEAWLTTSGGGFTAAGVGGGITGKGAHLLIIDDPIKNQEEADSALVRDKLWDWYQSTAYTRLAPGGGVLVIQTCWSDDDLAGRLQQAMRKGAEFDQFEIVKYPAISEQWEYRDDSNPDVPGPIIRSPTALDLSLPDNAGLTLLRPIDFCLHEARYSTEALKRVRANMQPRIWSALYQQNPVPDEGLYFRKEFFRFADQPALDNVRIFTAWDFAIGTKQVNDWTVGTTMALTPDDDLFVLDVHRMKGDALEIVEAMLNVAGRFGADPTVGYTLGVENGQIWLTLKPFLDRRMRERRLFLPIEVMKPLTDKMVRARPLQGRMQQGKLWFPKNATWFPQVEQELLRFPAGVHDDVVDSMAWATHLALAMEPPRIIEPPKPPSWRDKLLPSFSGTHMSA